MSITTKNKNANNNGNTAYIQQFAYYGGYSGYGGYGYGTYNGIQIKVWGRLVGNNELLLKVIFDNQAFRRWIDGTTGFHVTYRRADPETNLQNENVTFNVDPPAALTIVTTFDTGGDDS